MLVHNEDLHIERVFRNVIGFCDTMIVADNRSNDDTFPILSRLGTEFASKTQLVQVSHPRESHRLIQNYAGTDTWIFAVDGDEVYDPGGLRLMRARLMDGSFNDAWVLFGNVLNVVELDQEQHLARGYLAPPSRSMTKLFNFSAITEWTGRNLERLHGGKIRFKAGYGANLRRSLHLEMDWDAAFFRCLHLCFLRRSSVQDPGASPVRKSILDTYGWGWKNWRERLSSPWFKRKASDFKETRYKKGELVTKDVSAFF